MNLSDWIIDLALLLIVFRQLREERFSVRTVLLPLALIGWATSHYLHEIPTAGHDLILIVLFTVVGIAFGLAGGLLTQVRYATGHVLVKATPGAAALWVLSMGFRLGFAFWSSHSSGTARLTRFSVAHAITSSQAWVAALILMALGEVTVRLATMAVRGRLLATRAGRQAAQPAMPSIADRRPVRTGELRRRPANFERSRWPAGTSAHRAGRAVALIIRAGQAARDIHPDVTVDDVYLLFSTAPTDHPAAARTRWLTLVIPGLIANARPIHA